MATQPGYDWIDPSDYWDDNVGWNKFVDAVMSQRYRGRLTARRLDPTLSNESWLGEPDPDGSAPNAPSDRDCGTSGPNPGEPRPGGPGDARSSR